MASAGGREKPRPLASLQPPPQRRLRRSRGRPLCPLRGEPRLTTCPLTAEDAWPGRQGDPTGRGESLRGSSCKL